MRRRFLSVLAVVSLLLLALPLAVTAATPDIARISASSYQDLSRSRVGVLCERDDAGIPSILTTVRYSGTGEDLGGNGTGQLAFAISGSSFEVSGEIDVNGETKTVTGGGSLLCLFGGLAFVSGEVAIEGDGGTVYATLAGSMTDGAHPRQGSVSLTLVETEAPAVTSLDVEVTLDGVPQEGVSVNIYEGGVCGVGTSIAGLTGPDGVASFEVLPDVLYCASADPNNDVTFTEAVTSVPEGDPVDVDTTIAETSVPDAISVDVAVTLDGSAAAGVTVTFYSDDTCTTSIGTADTDASGIASLTVPSAGTYCASADPNNDTTASNTGAMTIDIADPVDVDGTIAETTTVLTSVDALVTLDGVAVGAGVEVSLSGYFMLGGGCLTPIATATTGADGVASFTNELTSDGWCVSADPNNDGTPTQVIVDMTNVPAGDPVDVDATIAETSNLFVDIVVTLDGSPAPGVTVSLCLTLICGPTTQTAVTDDNGRATFNDPNIFTTGESVTATANADGLGADQTTTFVLEANDPEGDTDATLDDFSPPA